MKKLLTELLGTFVLVFTTFNVIASPDLGPLGGVAIGIALMVAVYMGDHISGAHYNPAVSIGLFSSGNLEIASWLKYAIYQLIGAILGFLAVTVIRPDSVFTTLNISMNTAPIAEAIWTFLLVYVVHNITIAPANKGNSFYGFAIGATVLVGTLTLGTISGGVFNPAVTVAFAMSGILSWKTAICYTGVQLLTGIIAGVAFKKAQ